MSTATVTPIDVPDLVECPKCGDEVQPTGRGQCPDCGVFLPKNTAALVAGERSVQFWKAQEGARCELRAAIIRDAGHDNPDDAPEALSIAADSIAQAKLLRDSAFLRVVESGGPLTTAGRTRRAYRVWTSAMDRLERHLRLVGLKREPGTRRESPMEALEREPEVSE